ncbi:hypothetical protein Tco_1016176 [Tanacetum coccineum]|uniref:Retrotransposon gag domain-containing protein n=1 Tax=Tanacetum coccineum TaxID=301880 RepID=A0ABQ5FN09_9ASTR
MPTNLKIYDGSTKPDDHITRFVGVANQGEWEMPVWRMMFQQTLNGPTRGWFDCMPNGCIDSWANLHERFAERFTLRKKCSKDPMEVSKIIRRTNATLPDLKEHWTEEMGYIQGVPEVMQISAFMTNPKCSELARRFADRVPQKVTEMMQRVDDFVKSEEAYKSTELPKGEQPERRHEILFRGGRSPCLSHGIGHQKTNNYGRRDHYQPYVSPWVHDRRYDTYRHNNRRHDNRRQEVNNLRLDSLTKLPSEILATKLQLQLPPCPPTVAPPKRENLDRYYDYHDEKGHYTNDCYHLKRQLEAALKSGKLNHLVKDVRQRGNNRGRQLGNNNGRGRVINMIREGGDDRKRKYWRSQAKEWMNAPITFPPVSTDDVSDDPLIIEADVEGSVDSDLDRTSGFLWRAIDPHKESEVRGKVQRRQSLPKNNAEVHGSPYKLSAVTIPSQLATNDTPAVEEQTVLETFSNITPKNKAHYDTEKEAIHLILTGIGEDIYSTINACKTTHEMWIDIERLQHCEFLNKQDVKTKVNEIRAEKIARNANLLALVAAAQQYPNTYYQAPKPYKSYAPPSKQSSYTRSHVSTRHKDKDIAKPITPPSESASEEDSDLEQAQKDKDMESGDTNEELDEQELEAHYMYMAKIQEVHTTDSGPSFDAEPLEKVHSNDDYNVFTNER